MQVECKHCNKSFGSAGALIQHHQAKHPDRAPPKIKVRAQDDYESEADRSINFMLFGRSSW